jgi:hypothetical protein
MSDEKIPKLHGDEVDVDEALVRSLLTDQFPQWAQLPLRRTVSTGTDNAIYRLGDRMGVRVPRIHWAVHQIDIEYQWLGRLAPQLPAAVPEPLAKGAPGGGYPIRGSSTGGSTVKTHSPHRSSNGTNSRETSPPSSSHFNRSTRPTDHRPEAVVGRSHPTTPTHATRFDSSTQR